MPELDPQGFLSGKRLYADVQAYCDLGEHRTGTPVDLKTADWLAGQFEGVGVEPRRNTFTVPQFFVDQCGLRVDGKPIAAFPMWMPRAGTAKGPLVAYEKGVEVRGRIAMLRVPVAGASITPQTGHVEALQPLLDGGAAGIIAVTPSVSGELIALNWMIPDGPAWPVPIVLIGLDAEARIRGRGEAEIVIEGRYNPRAEAREVIGTVGQGERLIVVSTPYSGWFRCAGERGGGVALWLGVARWASHREQNARYLFVGSSGHELRGAGIRSFLEKHAPKPDAVHTWLHLGAGIAAYEFERGPEGPKRLDRAAASRRLLTNHRDWTPRLDRAFAGVAGLKPQFTEQPIGELAAIAQRGYRCWGFAGGHAYHHAPGDVPERVTSAALLEPVGRAIIAALDEFERA